MIVRNDRWTIATHSPVQLSSHSFGQVCCRWWWGTWSACRRIWWRWKRRRTVARAPAEPPGARGSRSRRAPWRRETRWSWWSWSRPSARCRTAGVIITPVVLPVIDTPEWHTPVTHLSDTPDWHTWVTQLSDTPDWHTWVTHLSDTPQWHTSVTHLSDTPQWHTWVTHLSDTPQWYADLNTCRQVTASRSNNTLEW